MKDIKLWHYAKGSLDPYTTFAWVGVEATGVKSFEGEQYRVGPQEGQIIGNGPMWAEHWIGLLEADMIKVFSKGGDKERNLSHAEIVIENGSLKNYYGAAYGGKADWLDVEHGGFAQQLLGSAQGNIVLSVNLRNNIYETTPRALSRTEIEGMVDKYSGRGQVARFGPSDVIAELTIEDLQVSGKLGHSHESSSRDGDWAICRMNMENGKLHRFPAVMDCPCVARIDGRDWGHTIAFMSLDADSQGSQVDYSSSYRNPGISNPITTFEKFTQGRKVGMCRAQQP